MTALIVDDTHEQLALLKICADRAKSKHIDCGDVDEALTHLSEVDRVITDGLDFGYDLERLVGAALRDGKQVTVVTGAERAAVDNALGSLAGRVNFVDRAISADIVAAFR
jgi:hypothetical protein